MSDHAWILENLAAYLAGGLEPAERERLEQHTVECAACTAAMNDIRAMDAALTGLFVEARPSAALEDHMIQTLRTRRLDAWRLPVPAWLAIAAAALVLIGFTGAVASQFLLHVGLSESPTGSKEFTFNGFNGGIKSEKNLADLTQESRQGMLSRLEDGDEAERLSGLMGGAGAESATARALDGRISNLASTPALVLPTPPATGAERSKREDVSRKSFSTTGVPNGSMGFGLGGFSDEGKSIKNGKQGLRGPLSTGSENRPYYFEPSKQLDQPLAEKDSKNESFARGLSLSGKAAGGGQGQAVVGQSLVIKDAREQKEQKANSVPPPPDKKPQEQPGPRKIVIRTGEIEYEVQSFDAAVATITRLIKVIKGGFIATVNSDKLANGKVRGSVVVRVPPENLDDLILELRTNLSKSGELKNQRLGSLDITKQYTDLESELKAARAMEERLLQIIKSGKGEIKDLLAAEKELGNWRTRIEKTEGELRYYANQVALSTLTITLYEKEITAPFAIIEREQVQMGIEVEEVDQALQTAQKAVREAKGRITRAELKQPSQGQFSARLDFEVAPDMSGPLRDRLKQLGTVARFDISRQEETQGGAGKPSDAKTRRLDTRFEVHLYNLTNVAPREVVQINLACTDVQVSFKTLLARVEKAAGRVVASNLNSARGDQAQADLQFEVKNTDADAVLEDVKAVGEVMRLNVTESTDIVNTTRKKRGFRVQLLALSAATAREKDELQVACAHVATSYRIVQEAVLKAKGRVHTAQLNEQDRRQVTATLDFEVRRADEDGIRAALLKAGAIYTRKVSRAADAENVVDSKVHWQVTFLNQANIPPRETYVYGIEVTDVDQAAAVLSALAGKRDGRIIKADISRDRKGQVLGELVYDVPMSEVHELIEALKSVGTVRVQKSLKHPEVPDSTLTIARLDVTLSNTELIVPSDDGFGPNVRRGLSDSFAVLSWSLRILILGLCVLLPWALVIWAIYRLVQRLRRRTTSTAPAA